VVGAHAHDLGAGGCELGQVLLEAEELLGSGARERLNEGEDDHGALGGQVGQLHGLAAGARQGEVGRFLADFQGGGRTGPDEAG